jgi:hypothetical protein
MPFIRKFEEGIVQPIERLLEAHHLTQQFFQGHLYLAIAVDTPFPGMDIEHPNGSMTTLDAKAFGRLCMIPDEYVVANLRRQERGPVPAGVAVQSTGPFLPEGQENCTVLYREAELPGTALDALYVAALYLSPDAPDRLGTVCVGLMAVSAYRLGFQRIRLFAAGRGPVDPEGYIGFDFWPKVGFDAPLLPVDLNRSGAQHLRGCQSIQDVRQRDPAWWPNRGWPCDMCFDLTAGSRSWQVLLKYLFATLAGDAK